MLIKGTYNILIWRPEKDNFFKCINNVFQLGNEIDK